MTTTLDLSAPLLPGRTVVEASAGTGKTHAIAAMVTRLVAAEGVPLEEILVVTFTRAATAELRHRVRAQLVATLRTLDDAGDEGPTVPLPPGDRTLQRRRLAEAVARFDRAQIFTIHGFAHRLLAHLGFLARIPATAEPGAVEEALLAQVAGDLLVARYAGDGGDLPTVGAGDAVRIGRAVTAVPDGRIVPTPDQVEGIPRARAEIAHALASEVRRRMRLTGAVAFDDALVEVRDALTDAEVADRARALLRRRYSVALVDECQDTDPIQWQVIEGVFRDARLVVIGDPKQSIYSFRGADIESYLGAVAGGDHHRSLDTNWRSDGPLLAALDRLFTGATFGDERIAYRTVAPAPIAARSRIHGPVVPLSIRVLGDDPSVERRKDGRYRVQAARRVVAADVAVRVTRLLAAGIDVDDDGARRDLGAGDLAVLCRTRGQVDAVRSELEARGVPSVAARTGGVFVSEAAEQWRRLLLAVERPDRTSYVRLAATTALAGDWTPGSGEISDEEVLSLQLACRRWHTLLVEEGIPALFADLDRRSGTGARVLARPDGERLMTDLIHIGEEMHAVWRKGRIGSLVGWLETAMAEAKRKDDAGIEETEARQRRLETDASAVQVLTVHGAKGLEFPVVLVPFAWDVPAIRPEIPVFHGGEPRSGIRPRMVDVGGKDSPGRREHVAAAMEESAAEEGRLLYVALTRARHHLSVWWVPDGPTAGTSKLGELLGGGGRLEELDSDAHVEVVALAPEAAAEPARLPTHAPVTLRRAEFGRLLDHSWRRASFSSLSPEHPLSPTGGHAEQELHLDEPGMDGDEPEPVAVEGLPMADLPRGARFGTLVHDLLERVDLGAPDLEDQIRRAVADTLLDPTWDFDGESLVAGLVGAVRTPLGPAPADLRLADLGGAVLDELRFEFPVRTAAGTVSLAEIAAVLARHLDPAHPFAGYAAELGMADSAPFRGFLTGAIDLTARIDNGGAERFVVFDYKSNVLPMLGTVASPADYGPGPLAEAMTGGHYVLQATIYQVALHRYLQWRLPAYEPERHLGGAVYLFLRGMVGPGTPVIDGERCGVVRWRPPAAMIVELSRLLAGGER